MDLLIIQQPLLKARYSSRCWEQEARVRRKAYKHVIAAHSDKNNKNGCQAFNECCLSVSVSGYTGGMRAIMDDWDGSCAGAEAS